MPRVKTFLTTPEYAVLGLVRQNKTYGYELQRHLSPAGGLGRVCPVEPAMIYAILKSLSGLELIDGEWDNSAYPPKAVYSTTETGEAEFVRWLRRPVSRMREVRFDFLVKLYFALHEGTGVAEDLLAAQLEVCDEYESHVAGELMRSDSPLFDRIVLESKASAARITREWIERTLATLPQGVHGGVS